jgi:hypothetical protein
MVTESRKRKEKESQTENEEKKQNEDVEGSYEEMGTDVGI